VRQDVCCVFCFAATRQSRVRVTGSLKRRTCVVELYSVSHNYCNPSHWKAVNRKGMKQMGQFWQVNLIQQN